MIDENNLKKEESELSESKHSSRKNEDEKKNNIFNQTGVVESIICAGIFYRQSQSEIPEEFNASIEFYTKLSWNSMNRKEIEKILNAAKKIHRNYNKRLEDKKVDLNDIE